MSELELHIRNYRRVKTVDVELGGITVVAGRNRQGKTSVAEAARAVLTGEPLVAADDSEAKRTQGNAKELIYSGESSGSATITNGDAAAQVSWPGCEFKTKGQNYPQSSRFAAGVGASALPLIKPKERLKFLHGLLGGDPTYADVRTYFEETSGVPSSLIEKVWQMIETKGWAATLEHSRTQGAQLKGQYREVTTDAWGVRKSANWQPEGWDVSLDGAKEDALVRISDELLIKLNEMIGNQAVNAQKIADLRKLASRVEELNTLADEASRAVTPLMASLDAAIEERDAIEIPDHEMTFECPRCKELVWLIRTQTTLTLETPMTILGGVDLKERRLKKISLEGEIKRGRAAALAAQGTADNLAIDLVEAQEAEEALKDLQDLDDPDNDQLISAATTALNIAKSRLALFRMKNRAQKLHGHIVTNQVIVGALDDTGVPSRVLSRQLSTLNAQLLKVGKLGGFTGFRITDGGLILVDGRPYRDLSGSEQLRVRAVFQVAIAQIDSSDFVVIDIDEATDRKHVRQLFEMLSRAKLGGALVCLHANRQDDVPDLSADGARRAGIVGRTYWVDDGVTAPLNGREKEAA